MWLKFIFIVNFCIVSALCHGSGAPESACADMAPRHFNFQPQQTELPVDIEIDPWIVERHVIRIRLKTNRIQAFRGFLIQARKLEDGELLGRFLPSMGVDVIDCNGFTSSAATHYEGSDKVEVLIDWVAPATTEIIIFNFFVTIVERDDIFWVGSRSNLLSIIPINMVPTPEPTTTEEGGTNPEETPTTTTPQDPDATTPSAIEGIYDGCGETKVCFGVPNHCYLQQNCDIFTAVTHANGNFTFEMLSKINHNYVAVGLSTTQNMGDATVMECVRQLDISAFSSWTIGRRVYRLSFEPDIIDLIDGSYVDGRIYCKIERIPLSTVSEQLFDLVNEKYYILLAGGPEVTDTTVLRHNRRGISHVPVLLTTPQNVAADTTVDTMILIHGSFMIVAWIGLTSIGIVLARYFKKSWPSMTVGKKQLWFVWHVCCMALTWALTIAGFVIIFVHTGEWTTSAHAIMGCIVLGFTILQPIGALFRPNPDAKSRSLFNWLHKALGNITHALAVITIFFSVRFPQTGLPQYTLYILAAFVSFYLLMHIIFTSVEICGQMREENFLRQKNTTKTVPSQILQKTLLGFFILSIIAFLIALLLVFNLGFDE